MFRKILIGIAMLLVANSIVYSQSGTLKGKITDKTTKEPVPFANIIIEQGGKQYGGATTDFDGNYTIKPIAPGKYDIKASYVGYKSVKVQGVVIYADVISFSDFTMESTIETLEIVEIKDYSVPIFEKGKTQGGDTYTAEQIQKMPGRSAEAIAINTGGVFSRDGSMGSVRGQRTDGTITYIDGVRVRGSGSIPKSAIEQVSMITGGTPAKYGEATGGVLNITTKGPSRIFGGSIEGVTSQFLDKFGYNVLGLSINGPLIKIKDKKSTDGSKIPLLGFFISAEGSYVKDGYPSSIGYSKVNSEKLNYIQQHPLRNSNEVGSLFSTNREAEFIRSSDIDKIYAKEDAYGTSLNVTGKIDVKTTKNTSLTFGGNYSYNKGINWSFANSLFNNENNSQSTNTTYRIFGRFVQRFPTETDSKAFLKNVFYMIQADYTKYHNVDESNRHQDRLFEYGYVGNFKSYKTKGYGLGNITVDGVPYENARIFTGYYDTLVSFQRSEINPILSNYTQQYYDLFKGQSFAFYNTTVIKNGKALLNGDLPDNIYGLFTSPGVPSNGYGITDQTQFGINANASADLGNHAIEFGIQYEQTTTRSLSYAPVGLWTLMRSLANRHIEQLDLSNPTLYLDEFGRETVDFNRLYDKNSQTYFDYNLRNSLGLNPTGTDWIDIDNLDPSVFSIDMFGADELLRDGSNALISYYGYDHTGKEINGQPSLDDFFTAKNEFGNYKREIGAYQPIYMAGYIQDNFSFKDLIFNIGVRVDRFDANQKVLKDPYLLYESYSVGSQKVQQLASDNNLTIPSTMGNDYVVYVNDYKDPTSIVGYRSGDTWYSSDGSIVIDPDDIATLSNGKIQPYLINPNQSSPSSSAFKDYDPQTTFMPRIAFSFPISEDAMFFAHYDVITKRPTTGVRMNPITYLYWEALAGQTTFSNPNLKPEKTINYELGFKQKLSASSVITISAYYTEMRDQVQAYRFSGAYPTAYTAFNNIDFGTVKGLTLAYDLRQTGNISLRASYTLQFANGTGSDATSGLNFVNSGQPNLRNLLPLDYDRRHAFTISFDYRFGSGKDYDGPKISKRIKGTDKVRNFLLLQNTGLNVSITGGSGVPYSKSSKIIPIGGTGQVLQGSLNGSRLPWEFFIDAKIDRDIEVRLGKDKGKNTKMGFINVYIQVNNILNTQNVMSVYRATGNPDDDGYLAAAEWQTQINQQIDPQSYRDLYSIAVNSPYNYSLPRRIHLGIIFGF